MIENSKSLAVGTGDRGLKSNALKSNALKRKADVSSRKEDISHVFHGFTTYIVGIHPNGKVLSLASGINSLIARVSPGATS